MKCTRCNVEAWNESAIQAIFGRGKDGHPNPKCKECVKRTNIPLESTPVNRPLPLFDTSTHHTSSFPTITRKNYLLVDFKWRNVNLVLPRHFTIEQWLEIRKVRGVGDRVFPSDGRRIWLWDSNVWYGMDTFVRLFGAWDWLECKGNEKEMIHDDKTVD
jgi:hypothetical protein